MRKPCADQKRETNKGAWSKEEDQKLLHYIRKHGEGSWSLLPQAAGLLRCGKSCRLRWLNYLKPDVKRGNFGEDEEELIIKLHALLGNRWSLIAGRLPGRTDNEVKNYWNTHLKRKLIQMGLDPNKHRIGQLVLLGCTNSTAKKGKYCRDYINKSEYSGNFRRSEAEEPTSDCRTFESESVMDSLPDLNLELTIGPPSKLLEV